MNLDLKGQSVFVSGGGSNIGRAVVLAFAEEGANITIADVDAVQAGKVADAAVQRGAGGVAVVKTNVSNLDQVQHAFKTAVSKFGTVDVLVNCVGRGSVGPFTENTPEYWQKAVEINYFGVLNCTKAALELMIPQNSGSIVSLSSDASRQGEAREAVYGGVKAAVNSFMKSIAKECGRNGIRCNTVCPGLTMPDEEGAVGSNSMWTNRTFPQEKLDKIASKYYPLGKLGKAVDIANAVVFLSSRKAAGHITGQVLSVSGGYSMVG